MTESERHALNQRFAEACRQGEIAVVQECFEAGIGIDDPHKM